MVLCLDAKCKKLGCHVVGEGSLHSANVSIRKIVKAVLATNATSVVLAHNHPGGLATPSGEDIQATQMIAKTLKTMDVVLVDHVIISDDELISLLYSGLYRPDM
jgi:DNA repair protein RadC